MRDHTFQYGYDGTGDVADVLVRDTLGDRFLLICLGDLHQLVFVGDEIPDDLFKLVDGFLVNPVGFYRPYLSEYGGGRVPDCRLPEPGS